MVRVQIVEGLRFGGDPLALASAMEVIGLHWWSDHRLARVFDGVSTAMVSLTLSD